VKFRLPAFAFLVLLVVVVSTSAQSQSCSPDGESNFCTIHFTSGQGGTTTGIYDFRNSGNGILTVKFDTVILDFDLTVSLDFSIDPINIPDAPGATCVKYVGSGNGDQCVQYDFNGNAGGPNQVPVKNVNYKGLISLTLSYISSDPVHIPVFGHAPGEITTFTEDILTSFSSQGPPPLITLLASAGPDPTMGGKTPGLSSVIALDESLPGSGTVCGLTAQPQKSASGQNPIVEISFQLFAGATCSGTPLKDKTASLSVALVDSSNNFLLFASLVNGGDSNKFHWFGNAKTNVQDINTQGLPDGIYSVTVMSDNFSPVSTKFCIVGGNVSTCS